MRGKAKLVARYALLVVLAGIVLFPIYLTFVNALLTPARLSTRPPALAPAHPQWHNFADAWTLGHLGRYLGNSAIVSIAIMVGQVVSAVLAAYAFAFLRFPLRNVLFVVFLATLMIPGEVTFFTNVDTIRSL